MNLLDLVFPKDMYCVSCGRPLPAQAPGGIALCEGCSDEIEWIDGRSCAKCGRPLADENPMEICRDCAGASAHTGASAHEGASAHTGASAHEGASAREGVSAREGASAQKERFFGRGYACALYTGRAAGLVREMKYQGRAWYGDTLSAIMAERYLSMADEATGELPWYDCIVAVPSSPGRKAARGFNQAAVLAEGLSRRAGIPLYRDILARVRETGVMSSLTEEERRQNLGGAFVVNCDMMKRMMGKRVLLVDDICTTGSTADACAEALLATGAQRVDFIVFAIGADARRAKGRPAVVESPGQLRAKGPT